MVRVGRRVRSTRRARTSGSVCPISTSRASRRPGPWST